MRKLIIMLTASIMVSCDNVAPDERLLKDNGVCPYVVTVIDNCEYIVFKCGTASWGSHKGNCKNHKIK